jgi:hypothetical protein
MNANKTGNSAPDSSPVALAHNTRLVPDRARELLNDQHNGRPVWIRCPKQGVDFYSGFNRGKLYELASSGAIRCVSIREPGQVRGTRLFNLASILAFIEKCEHGAVEEVAAQKTKPANSASNDPAKRGDTSFPLHPSRKRRRAETIAPSCPL